MSEEIVQQQEVPSAEELARHFSALVIALLSSTQS